MTAEVALVSSPCFAVGSPPLALASIQAALRAAGVETVAYDLDFMLMRDEPETFNGLYLTYFIGHRDGIDQVQFLIRPTLLLMALFPAAFSAEEQAPYAADLAVVARAERYLDGWAERILAGGARVVMCTTYVSSLLATLLLAKALKARDPDVRVVVGGPGVGMPEAQELVLRLGCVDVCAKGEGETVAPPIAQALLAGDPPRVPGAAFLDGDQTVRTPQPPLLPLAELHTPDFSGLPVPGHALSHYRSNPNVNMRWLGTALPVATTRGCVMRCTFCSETNYWERFRQREPARVVAEIAELKRRWGVRQFLFGDSLLNGRRDWLEAFADLCLAEELDVEFVFAYFRPTQLPRPLLEKLARAGFRLLAFGLESGSQAMLDAMHKGTKAVEAEQVILDALDVGIHVNVSILCGIPSETVEHVMESVRFVQRLRARVRARSGPEKELGLTVHAGWPLRVEPYSKMFQQPERSGITIEPLAPELPDGLRRLEPYLAPLLQRWSAGIAQDEVDARAQMLRDAINSEPRTVFQGEPVAEWIEDPIQVAPVRPTRLMSDTDGRHYLIADAKVEAELNDLARRAWEQIAQGATFGEARDAIARDVDDPALEDRLRSVYVQLLNNRLVYVEDFRVPTARPAG